LRAIFSRPSVWLAAGTMFLLILMASFLALRVIPTEQRDAFIRLESGIMLLFGIMVRDVFHGDNK
jgi:cytochrome c biogenesis protein CcdA